MIVEELAERPVFYAKEFHIPSDGDVMKYNGLVVRDQDEYLCLGEHLSDGNWLLTDEDGNVRVVDKDRFRSEYELSKDKSFCRQKPKRYKAQQFDERDAEKHGVGKYQVVRRKRVSAYAEKRGILYNAFTPFIPSTMSYVVLASKDRGPVLGYDTETGRVDFGGDMSCHATAPVKKYVTEVNKNYFPFYKKETIKKPVYDFKAPELYEWKCVYYTLNGSPVHHLDWLLTDSDGETIVCKPDDFEKKFKKIK